MDPMGKQQKFWILLFRSFDASCRSLWGSDTTIALDAVLTWASEMPISKDS